MCAPDVATSFSGARWQLNSQPIEPSVYPVSEDMSYCRALPVPFRAVSEFRMPLKVYFGFVSRKANTKLTVFSPILFPMISVF